jgi:hypothetical protein
MNILCYQSFETKGDRFQKYKQSKSVFDSEDKKKLLKFGRRRRNLA